MMCLVFTSCSTTEDKLEKSIKNYVHANWNDANTYESISFSKLDTSFVCSECSEIIKEKSINLSNLDSSSKCSELIIMFLNNSESDKKIDSLKKRRDYFTDLYDKNSKELWKCVIER
jgi:hypothetical protein